MKNHSFIYSTDPDFSDSAEKVKVQYSKPNEQHIRIHLDRKGGGKIVPKKKKFVSTRAKRRAQRMYLYLFYYLFPS